MRVLIIGIGGVGAMAAWRLAATGHEVIGFEQFDIDHDLGSSFGDSRIIRRVYPDTLYTDMMADSYALWDTLQAEFPNEELIRRHGGLFLGLESHPILQQAHQALIASKVDFEYLTAHQCRDRFPAFHLHPEEVALFEPSMGYVRPSLSIQAALRLATRHGAVLHTHTEVTKIEPTASGVRIVTREGAEHLGDRLIITAGPWTGTLLAQHHNRFPLQVTRQTYIHLAADTGAFGAEPFPVWIDSESNYYGFPQIGAIPGFKIAHHLHGMTTTPETVNREVATEETAHLIAYAQARLPGIGDQITYSKVCLYTNTPDEDFLIGSLPGYPHTYLVGGLSGHGFKFTPLLGKILCQLATTGSTDYDLTRFRLNRFD